MCSGKETLPSDSTYQYLRKIMSYDEIMDSRDLELTWDLVKSFAEDDKSLELYLNVAQKDEDDLKLAYFLPYTCEELIEAKNLAYAMAYDKDLNKPINLDDEIKYLEYAIAYAKDQEKIWNSIKKAT